MGRASSFAVCTISLEPRRAVSIISDDDAFEIQPPELRQRHRGTALASISASFLQRMKTGQQKSKPAALFSISKVDAKATGPKPERGYKIIKIAPDGRCLFRALASGMSYNQGYYTVGTEEEEKDADALRMATYDALCRNSKRQAQFKEAIFAAKQEDNMPRYCARLQEPTFWGGNVEMLVISKMLQVPITVMQDVAETDLESTGYLPIAKYGSEFLESRKPVTVLYRSGNHYDLLFK